MDNMKLSPLNVCSLALGCIIGWGAFVMPGTEFLPKAGPIGTAIAIFLAAAVMWVIAVNYGYMVNKYPASGGECVYAQEAFGRKHAYICGWFLGLSYLCIVPLNATALSLIGRNLLGEVFQTGFSYNIAGYNVYFGEVLLAEIVLIVFAIISIRGVKMAGVIQTVLCFALVLSVILITIVAFTGGDAMLAHLKPEFGEEGGDKIASILSVFAVAPWAFIGFDTVPQATEEFGFSIKKTRTIMFISIAFGALVYVMLTIVTACAVPDGYGTWAEYIQDLDHLNGLIALPTFHAAYQIMGEFGLVIIGVAVLGAILSGIIGFYMATSRLLFALGRDNYLPKKFCQLHSKYNTPVYSIIFVMIISLIAPWFGRTALGWIVDMSSLGSAIGYGYTSAATVCMAKKENNKKVVVSGIIGVLFSLVFAALLIIPIPDMNASLSKESYICLLVWIMLGIVLVRIVVRGEKRNENVSSYNDCKNL